jgi:hypothetical protein
MGRQVDANTVTWSERIQGQLLSTTEMTFQVVEDGKIRSLVYRSGRRVPGPGGLAGTTSPESAGAVLAALVLLGLGWSRWRASARTSDSAPTCVAD